MTAVRITLMSLSWLQKITNPKAAVRVEKSRVMESNIIGAGLPLTPDPRSEMFGPDYKGKITPQIAGKIYANMPVVRRCADIIASYASSVHMCCYKRRGKDSEWVQDDSLIPSKMLDYVNPVLTPGDYIAKIAYFLTLYENAYVAIEPSPASHRHISPYALWPMNPAHTTVITDRETGVRFYKYSVNGHEPQYFDYDKVIHIGGFSPFDDFYGLLKLNAFEYDIRSERHAKKFLGQFYNKAAMIAGVLTINGDNEDDIEKYRRQLANRYSGSENAFRVLVLEEGMKYETPQSNNIEVNALPAIEGATKTGAMLFGVPLGLLTQSTANTDLFAEEEIFWNMTLLPLLNRIAQHHDKKIAKPLSNNLLVKFDLKGVLALKRSMINVAKTDVAYLNTGKNTINEIRAAHGEAPLTGDLAEFGDTPIPVWQTKQAEKMQASAQEAQLQASQNKPGGNPAQRNGTSPSLSMTGTEGGKHGRNQSQEGGETELIDETGRKALETFGDPFVLLMKQAISDPDVFELDPQALALLTKEE